MLLKSFVLVYLNLGLKNYAILMNGATKGLRLKVLAIGTRTLFSISVTVIVAPCFRPLTSNKNSTTEFFCDTRYQSSEF